MGEVIDQARASAMEHKVLTATDLINEAQLNAMAAEGWMLIQIVHNPDDRRYYFYFRRERKPSPRS